jgi:hypothetical protein
LDEDEERARQLETLYREEGVALAAHEAFEATGNAITTKYIEPLAKEVESRWKRMFGAGGLTLSPEGRITRQVGSRTLEFGSLSGGEKVWALLASSSPPPLRRPHSFGWTSRSNTSIRGSGRS